MRRISENGLESWYALTPNKTNNPTNNAKAIREEFNEYFYNEGCVHGNGVVLALTSKEKINQHALIFPLLVSAALSALRKQLKISKVQL